MLMYVGNTSENQSPASIKYKLHYLTRGTESLSTFEYNFAIQTQVMDNVLMSKCQE